VEPSKLRQVVNSGNVELSTLFTTTGQRWTAVLLIPSSIDVEHREDGGNRRIEGRCYAVLQEEHNEIDLHRLDIQKVVHQVVDNASDGNDEQVSVMTNGDHREAFTPEIARDKSRECFGECIRAQDVGRNNIKQQAAQESCDHARELSLDKCHPNGKQQQEVGRNRAHRDVSKEYNVNHSQHECNNRIQDEPERWCCHELATLHVEIEGHEVAGILRG